MSENELKTDNGDKTNDDKAKEELLKLEKLKQDYYEKKIGKAKPEPKKELSKDQISKITKDDEDEVLKEIATMKKEIQQRKERNKDRIPRDLSQAMEKLKTYRLKVAWCKENGLDDPTHPDYNIFLQYERLVRTQEPIVQNKKKFYAHIE